MTPMTQREKQFASKNILAACRDIEKLNGTGYKFLMMCSGFIAHYNLEGFKSLRLESVLWLLEEIGTLREQKEYPSCLNRDYKYEAHGFQVRVCAYVKDDSPTCRKVVVGTDTVTTPKYAIQCD